MSEKTIFCGKGKRQETGKGMWLKCTINPAVIAEHVEEYEGHEFVRLNININDTPDKYGKDVSISIDTWEPEGKNQDTDKLPI